MSISRRPQPTVPCDGVDHHDDAVSHEAIYRRVRAALRAAGASPDEVEEISQAAVVEAWVRDTAIRDRDKVVSYTVTIAMRSLMAERRTRDGLSSLSDSTVDLADGSADPGVRMEHMELVALVVDALERLTERDRYLVLAGNDGVSVDAMGAATGLQRDSVAPSLHRARRRLMAHLANRNIGAHGLAG